MAYAPRPAAEVKSQLAKCCWPFEMIFKAHKLQILFFR